MSDEQHRLAGGGAASMLNFGSLINTVQRNCDISDARYAGNYTMCIFLLKMREYYRWEHEIPFSCALPHHDLGSWLVEREQAWETLEDRSYEPLPLSHGRVDPFDYAAINAELIPSGYVYSSGLGLFNKPHFLLGRLLRHEVRDGVTVLVASCEYARDLVAPPAMSLGRTVFVSQGAVRRFLWEKIEEANWRRRGDTPVHRAIACYHDYADEDELLDRMADTETEGMILHELGEVQAGELLGPQWEEMLATLPRSRAEFTARAIRDHLADCLVTLPRLVETGDEAALHLWFANLTGMRKALFPEAANAYARWRAENDLTAVEATGREGRQRWLAAARRVLEIYREGPERCQEHLDSFACSAG